MSEQPNDEKAPEPAKWAPAPVDLAEVMLVLRIPVGLPWRGDLSELVEGAVVGTLRGIGLDPRITNRTEIQTSPGSGRF